MISMPVPKHGSHLPVLIRAVALTDGPVLEMGMGYFSTTFLHWACATTKRQLVSYENQPEFFKFAKGFETDFHEIHCIDNWTRADIERPWDVAFIDHEPARQRIKDIARLANHAKYVVLHDTAGRYDHYFQYSKIYPLFEWQYNYDYYRPKSCVLSNFVDLSDFGKDWE